MRHPTRRSSALSAVVLAGVVLVGVQPVPRVHGGTGRPRRCHRPAGRGRDRRGPRDPRDRRGGGLRRRRGRRRGHQPGGLGDHVGPRGGATRTWRGTARRSASSGPARRRRTPAARPPRRARTSSGTTRPSAACPSSAARSSSPSAATASSARCWPRSATPPWSRPPRSPRRTPRQARRGAVAARPGWPSADLPVAAEGRWVWDPAVLGALEPGRRPRRSGGSGCGDGVDGARTPSWSTTAPAASLLDVDGRRRALDRVVCDRANVPRRPTTPCTSGFARTEGQRPLRRSPTSTTPTCTPARSPTSTRRWPAWT